MWTITATVRRKSLDKVGPWTYVLECQDQQFAYDHDEFSKRIKQSRTSIDVIGHALTDHRVKLHNWSLVTLAAQDRFSLDEGISWIEYDGRADHLYFTVALGTKNEALVQELINEALRSPGLYIAMTLNIGFSNVEGNELWPEPTKRRFLEGEAIFAHGPPDFALVSWHP